MGGWGVRVLVSFRMIGFGGVSVRECVEGCRRAPLTAETVKDPPTDTRATKFMEVSELKA